MNPADKRLAVTTEDHPLAYAAATGMPMLRGTLKTPSRTLGEIARAVPD